MRKTFFFVTLTLVQLAQATPIQGHGTIVEEPAFTQLDASPHSHSHSSITSTISSAVTNTVDSIAEAANDLASRISSGVRTVGKATGLIESKSAVRAKVAEALAKQA